MSGMPDRSRFDNVFVNPEAYQAFVETGTWPDKTVLGLETRGAQTKAPSIAAATTRTQRLWEWKFTWRMKRGSPGSGRFSTLNTVSGNLVPAGAACYSCHAEHAAVDTTFVQFYPTPARDRQEKGRTQPAYLPAYLKETTTLTTQ